MKSFPENIHFKYPWRNYQEKVLNELDFHLEDNHLHIVAPPGSGKTVLGLEVMLRINLPTLIIAPTIAIKNQWKQRFCELFLDNNFPDWISTDINKPQLITISTYQGIHAFCNDTIEIEEESEEESNILVKNKSKNSLKSTETLIKLLKKAGIKVFILDEAHHLKNAWWKSLFELKYEINPKIVALTATPPFDVSPNEWKRYIDLNGAVDTEISVPELMKEKDLCPHQDLVFFTFPSEVEKKEIENIQTKSLKFFNQISNDQLILIALQNHDIYINPENHLDWIYENISSYSSGLVFLNHHKIKIDKKHFEIIGDQDFYIPELNFFWLEELLDFFIYSDYFKNFEEYRIELESKLKRNGFLDKKYVNFSVNENINKTLSTSISKLQAIKEIVDLEFKNLKKDLRLVILTDYIRKEYLSQEAENNFTLDKIGVVSIFEKLRRDNSQNLKIGVLSGSIVIIPNSALENLKKQLIDFKIENLNFQELSYDKEYCIIYPNEAAKNNLVHLITEIFQKGEIQVLIGTKSLLGEGWDAPEINSLILSSFISSFVLSNQMRGRAIRISKNNLDKTSNIWHLACVDTQNESGGYDVEILKKRFKTFVGLSNNQELPSIQNRFERLNITDIRTKEDLESANAQSANLASNRSNLAKSWEKALEKGNVLIEEIQVPFDEKNYQEVKLKYLQKTLGNLSGILISTILIFSSDFLGGILKGLGKFQSIEGLEIYFLLFGSALFITYGGFTYRTLKQYLKYKNISKNLLKIGRTVMMSLMNEKIIKTPASQLKLIGNQSSSGDSSCYLDGGTNYEKSIFIQTLQEAISPIDNPRYLILQNDFYKFPKNKSYFAVPEIFGRNKKSAIFYENQWNQNVGNSSLIFTRTLEGRNLLLKLRLQSMLKKNKHIEHINKLIK
ncbi:hypothetical protein GCM10010992_22630 [Cloacibacterium rupense]|uniref:Helicase ATP-binding domain-containing protein n=1 Tax=Cloacibacterium rupense TaxID=517423 RepID=A0ABQ2NNB2_9FLAO|nr:DEAD/DEAH box helicase family protein [Cloacibacterium rupense]GGP05660.1 hypothetical protein GCM10010992_22630 [Cloacibacterium rupense]